MTKALRRRDFVKYAKAMRMMRSGGTRSRVEFKSQAAVSLCDKDALDRANQIYRKMYVLVVNLTQSSRVQSSPVRVKPSRGWQFSLAWVTSVYKGDKTSKKKTKKRRSKRKLQKLYPFIKNGQAWMEHPRIDINADGEVKGGPVFFFRLAQPSLVLFGGWCRYDRGAILENLTTGKPMFDFSRDVDCLLVKGFVDGGWVR